MGFDLTSNMDAVMQRFEDVATRQMPFALSRALNATAQDVRAAEVATMSKVFDRPTPYTLNAIAVKPATMRSKIASVEFKEGFAGTPAKRFLNPQVNGGARSQKSHELQIAPLLRGYSYLVPAKGFPLNAYGNVPGGTIRKIISQLKVSKDQTSNASQSRRSKAKRKAQAFFIPKGGRVILERKGRTVTPALIGVRAPRYAKRFPFYETAQQVIAERLDVNFEIALQRAMATSNSKGKWR